MFSKLKDVQSVITRWYHMIGVLLDFQPKKQC